MPEHLVDGARDIIKDIILESEIFILFAWNAPIKEYTSTPGYQVLYETIAWHSGPGRRRD